jgi:hypothetical protein
LGSLEASTGKDAWRNPKSSIVVSVGGCRVAGKIDQKRRVTLTLDFRSFS